MLADSSVVGAMAHAWRSTTGAASLARRLLAALRAGQEAGGDPRGKQSAALLVVASGAGYGGLSDVLVDLRSDNASEPLDDLARMLDLHDLSFGTTPEDQLLPSTLAQVQELAQLLAPLGFGSDDVAADLWLWMTRANLEERWHDGRLDPVVLDQLRRAAGNEGRVTA